MSGMEFIIDGRAVATDEQGFIADPAQWSEAFARALAARSGLELYVDHWELIWYFRDYYQERAVHPTMHQMVLDLGARHGERFRDRKEYEQHLYRLFPTDPIHELCRLAGLPRPEPDT